MALEPLHLARLPRDVQLEFASYLTAGELCTLATTSRELRQLADDTALWRAVLIADFDVRTTTTQLVLLFAAPKRAYAARVEAARAADALACADRAASLQQRAEHARRQRVAAAVNAAALAPLVTLPVWLLAFLALLAGKLDGGLDGWGWGAVFAPLYVLYIGAGGATCAALVAHAREGPALGPLAPPVSAVAALANGGRRSALAHLLLLAAALLALPPSVALRLQLGDGGGFTWGLALAPLWAAFALHALAPCCRSGLTATQPRWHAHVCLWACGLAPVLAACVALAVLLDGGGARFPLALALTPVWLLLGASLLSCALTLAHAALLLARRRATRAEACSMLAAVLLALLLLLPPALFLLMLCLKVDAPAAHASLPWRAVFAPLMFWLSAALLLALMLGPLAAFEGVYALLAAAQQRPLADPFAPDPAASVGAPAAAPVAAGGGAAAPRLPAARDAPVVALPER